MSSSYSVTAKSQKMELNCYKMENIDNHSLVMRLEIGYLAAELKNSVAKFSARNLFDVNLNTLCGILTTTLTYFVVIIQLQ